MFGTLLIPGICAVISSKPLDIRKLVLCRDSLFFLLCMIGVVWFIYDGTFYPIESIYLLIIYIIYVIFIFASPMVRRSFHYKNTVFLLSIL